MTSNNKQKGELEKLIANFAYELYNAHEDLEGEKFDKEELRLKTIYQKSFEAWREVAVREARVESLKSAIETTEWTDDVEQVRYALGRLLRELKSQEGKV